MAATMPSGSSSGPWRSAVPAIQRSIQSTGAIGASVVIVRGGAIVYERSFGKRAGGAGAATRDTRFEIGSLTKQFTAAAILQLKEHGRLRLDDPLSAYVPGFPHAREVTLRQLLSQTSGLPDFMETNHFLHLSHTTAGSVRAVERMASGPLHFAPGSRWEYSNTNYFALGRVIEVASGETYDTYVRVHLFVPAGMTHSATIAQEARIKDLATGYWRGMRGRGPLTPAPSTLQSWTWSAGDIVSTAGDVARWDIALADGRIISRADFGLMTRPAKLTNGKTVDYAFGWWTDPLMGHRLFAGLGDTYGFSSANEVFPDDHLAIIVLENVAVTPRGESDAAGSVAADTFKALLRLDPADRSQR